MNGHNLQVGSVIKIHNLQGEMMINEIVSHFETRFQLAIALGCPNSNVYKWCRDKTIPYKHLVKIEELTNGKFKADDVRDYQIGNT